MDKKTWGLLVAVLLSIGGLGLAYGLSRETSKLSPSVCDAVLRGKPCALPCWQGLKIGDTADSQALLSFIEEFSNTDYIDTRNIYNPLRTTILWNWVSGEGEIIPGRNTISIENQTITGMEINTNCTLPVESILRKYSTPAAFYVSERGYHENKYIGAQLYYPELGVIFVLGLSLTTPVITATTPISSFLLVPPESREQLWARESEHLHPWPGYGDISRQIIVRNP